MQPYIFPYIGYFQLINCVDEFIVYDNIQYTKQGWINRNRILMNGADTYFTLPLKKDSDYLDVDKRFLSDNWAQDRKHLLNKVAANYRRAPHFKETIPLIEQVLRYEATNLFLFLHHSLQTVSEYLGIKTEIVQSSAVQINHTLKSADKVIAICKAIGASKYVNPIGGLQLYNKDHFKEQGIELKFLKTGDIHYQQFDQAFVPSLSIIDVLMFNAREQVMKYLNQYTLI